MMLLLAGASLQGCYGPRDGCSHGNGGRDSRSGSTPVSVISAPCIRKLGQLSGRVYWLFHANCVSLDYNNVSQVSNIALSVLGLKVNPSSDIKRATLPESHIITR